MLLLLSVVAFCGSMVHALVITGWRDAIAKAMDGGAEPRGHPDLQMVSMVVPARNAADTLMPLLQDLHAQQWPRDLVEVLVMDDGSTDGTGAQVRGMMRTWPGLRLLAVRGEGKKTAIAQGVAEARGEWVVLTDADARCGPMRIRQIMDRVAHGTVDMLLLPVETRAGTSLLQALQADEQAGMLGIAAGTALQGNPVLANGANMAFRKEAFLAVGGYAGDRWASGDDIFLLRRMLKSGRNVQFLLDPRVLVSVEGERGSKAFWSQRLRWAGKMRSVGGAGNWAATAALLWPWFLLMVSCSFGVRAWMGPHLGAGLMLVAAAWLLWLLPVVALVRGVRRFYRAAGAPRMPMETVRSIVSCAAFHLYAPVVAVASLGVRPHWKGRRV